MGLSWSFGHIERARHTHTCTHTHTHTHPTFMANWNSFLLFPACQPNRSGLSWAFFAFRLLWGTRKETLLVGLGGAQRRPSHLPSPFWVLAPLGCSISGVCLADVSLTATLVYGCFSPPWAVANIVAFYSHAFKKPPWPFTAIFPKAHPAEVGRFLWSRPHLKTIASACDLFLWANERRRSLDLSVPRDAHTSYSRMHGFF